MLWWRKVNYNRALPSPAGEGGPQAGCGGDPYRMKSDYVEWKQVAACFRSTQSVFCFEWSPPHPPLRRHPLQAGEGGEFQLISGRLAAATAWPMRRVFSSGSIRVSFLASSGWSSFSTRQAVSRMISPPRADMTRPIRMIRSMS